MSKSARSLFVFGRRWHCILRRVRQDNVRVRGGASHAESGMLV